MRRLKGAVEFICAALYAVYLLLLRCKSRRVVIYYHGINKANVCGFENQLAYLAKKCSVVRPSNIASGSADDTKVLVAITFDDAFTSVYENAVPVLRKYGLPAAVSVPTGNLGKPPNWALDGDCHDADEIVMNEEQLVELDKAGYEILSHTVSHPRLTRIDDVELEAELERSKQTLERIAGRDIIAVCYPHGDYNDKICKVAERLGYKIGFCIEPYSVDSSPNSFQIGRFEVSPTDSMLKFRLKLIGAYEIVKYIRILKRMLFQP